MCASHRCAPHLENMSHLYEYKICNSVWSHRVLGLVPACWLQKHPVSVAFNPSDKHLNDQRMWKIFVLKIIF
jgi:hypothetical protein